MPTKISLALGRRRTLSPETALGCLSSNLAVPGSGSLLAGRISGYGQLLLAVGGLVMSLLFGARFVVWCLRNWSAVQDRDADPIITLTNLWLASRWALLGFALFGIGWVWGLITSLHIVREAKQGARPPEPPILT